MIDLEGMIDIFIITNGRSTYEYCKKSVDNQKDVKFKINIIRDMDWQSAHEELLRTCGSKFALRVDDDIGNLVVGTDYGDDPIEYETNEDAWMLAKLVLGEKLASHYRNLFRN